jgi:long-chain acyl-CoA synthetase
MMPPDTNVSDFLLAGKPPGQVALRLLDRDYTYGELDRATSAVACFLRDRCRTAGERVVLAGENSFFWVAAYLGILRSGRIAVPVPPAIPAETLNYILETTEARLVFADPALVGRSRQSFRDCQVLCPHEVLALSSPAGSQDCLNPNPSELAALMFTSGSTGNPRGVMVSHGNIVANTNSILQYLELTSEDRMMTVLPFHYCFGASLLHSHLRAGASLVIDSRFMYPELVLQRMIDAQCTGFAGVPSHFQILLRRSSLRERKFPSLRAVQQAGGPLPAASIQELRQALPDAKIFIMYGQTEATARLSYLPPELLEQKLGSIGKGLPGTNLAVLGESGHPVRPGEVGEIVAEGANITLGYWRAPAETAASFRKGRLYTGDLATVDADGFIYIAGRSKDFLKCGGKRISCRQLEEQVLEFAGVLEAAVVGIPDEVLGDAVRLFVVPQDGGSAGLADRLRALCRKKMLPPLVPKEILVLEALPKNSAGKILKEELKRLPCAAPCH